MPHSEDHTAPDVSTEPQRRALDEMSRQLVERLNEMVREQNERARRFAATQHSLSPLPEMPEPEAPALLPPPPAPAPAPKKRKLPGLSPRPERPLEPQVFDDKPLPEFPGSGRPVFPAANSGNKKEESGCGTLPTVIAIVIIIIMLRACS